MMVGQSCDAGRSVGQAVITDRCGDGPMPKNEPPALTLRGMEVWIAMGTAPSAFIPDRYCKKNREFSRPWTTIKQRCPSGALGRFVDKTITDACHFSITSCGLHYKKKMSGGLFWTRF